MGLQKELVGPYYMLSYIKRNREDRVIYWNL